MTLLGRKRQAFLVLEDGTVYRPVFQDEEGLFFSSKQGHFFSLQISFTV